MNSYSVVFSFCIIAMVKQAGTITSFREYCENFPENLRPILCILQDNDLVPKSTTTTRRPPWASKGHGGWGWNHHHHSSTPAPGGGGWGWEDSSSEEDEQQCSCDLTCYPPPVAPGCDATVEYNCVNTCGSNCDVTTNTVPRCECATIGTGTDSCNCSVTCATNPSRHDEQFCIFNVTGVIGPCSGRPVDCECCKSRATVNNRNPDFVCVCQSL